MNPVRGTIFLVLGLLLSSPFLFTVFIAESTAHFVTGVTFLLILGMLIGGPLIMIGIVLLLLPDGRNTTVAQNIELSRIRFSTEEQMRKDK